MLGSIPFGPREPQDSRTRTIERVEYLPRVVKNDGAVAIRRDGEQVVREVVDIHVHWKFPGVEVGGRRTGHCPPDIEGRLDEGHGVGVRQAAEVTLVWVERNPDSPIGPTERDAGVAEADGSGGRNGKHCPREEKPGDHGRNVPGKPGDKGIHGWSLRVGYQLDRRARIRLASS